MKLSFNKEIGKYELIQDDKIIGTSKSKKYLENKMAKILNNGKPQNKNDSENIIKKYCEKIKVDNKNEDTNKYRLDLDLNEILKLKLLLEENKSSELTSILDKVDNIKIIKSSDKKKIAIDKARETRSQKIKVKIQNAINILRLEDKKITHYSIAKVGKVSYITVKKHISDDKIISYWLSPNLIFTSYISKKGRKPLA